MVDAAKENGIEADQGFEDELFPFSWLITECYELRNKFNDCQRSKDESWFLIDFLSFFLKLRWVEATDYQLKDECDALEDFESLVSADTEQ